jgi:hypothetical protein
VFQNAHFANVNGMVPKLGKQDASGATIAMTFGSTPNKRGRKQEIS